MKETKQATPATPLEQLTDTQLVRRVRTGSHACFDQLVFRYSARLFQFLLKRLPTAQDAEDVIQETFIKAFQNIETYDPQWKFSTWLYTIAVRLTVSHFRTASAKLSQRTAGFIDDGDTLPAPVRPLDLEHDMENVWLLARQMKKELYETLWLRYGEDMSIKEIAVVMDKSQIHIRVLLHRARLKLSGLVGQPTTGAAGHAPISTPA